MTKYNHNPAEKNNNKNPGGSNSLLLFLFQLILCGAAHIHQFDITDPGGRAHFLLVSYSLMQTETY